MIVCAPRSGSTWLHTLLNSHPQIISHGEILRETYEVNANTQLPSIDKIVFHPHHKSIQAVGLKLFYEYESNEAYQKSFSEIVKDKTVCIIHLVREDKPSQFKSLKRAEATQQWSSGKTTNQIPIISIDPVDLMNYQGNLFKSEQQINELFQHHPILKIKYEDLLSDQENILTKIQNFLNVEPRKLFSLLKKQS